MGEGGERGQSHRYLKGAVLLSFLSKESKEEIFQGGRSVWGLLTGAESLDWERCSYKTPQRFPLDWMLCSDAGTDVVSEVQQLPYKFDITLGT